MGLFARFGVDENKVNQDLKDLSKLNLNNSNSFWLFSYSLKSGFVDLTEMGESEEKDQANNHSFLERIWTGQDNAIAQWDNSFKLKTSADKSHVETTWQKGEGFRIILYSTSTSSNFGETTLEEGYIDQVEIKDFTAFVPVDQIVMNDEYTKKLFKMPQLTSKWVRIEDYETVYNLEERIVGYTLNLITQSTETGTTGISVNSTINDHEAGGVYAHPTITDDGYTFEVVDEGGVDEIQIELLGNMALVSLGAIGREHSTAGNINQPSYLLTHTTNLPKETIIKKTSAPSSSLTVVHKMKPTLQTNYKTWKDKWTQGFDWSIRKSFEGIFDTDHVATSSDDFRNKVPWDITNTINVDNFAYNSQNSPYVRSNVTLSGTKTLGDFLAFNLLAYNHISQLPMEVRTVVPYKASSTPVIGGILKMFSFGFPIGLNRITTDMKITNGIYGLMDYEQYMFATEAQYSSQGFIDAEMFDNTEDSPIGSIVGSRSTNTTLRFKLSNLFTTGGTTHNTKELGKVATPYNNSSSVATSTNKFVIDRTIANIIGKGEYIISYFKDGQRIRENRYQTMAKWTNNIRNWTNIIKNSAWQNAYIEDQDMLEWNHIDLMGNKVQEMTINVPSNFEILNSHGYPTAGPLYRLVPFSKTISRSEYDLYNKIKIDGVVDEAKPTSTKTYTYNSNFDTVEIKVIINTNTVSISVTEPHLIANHKPALKAITLY